MGNPTLSRGPSPIIQAADSDSATESDEAKPSIVTGMVLIQGSSSAGASQQAEDTHMRSPTSLEKPSPAPSGARSRSATKAPQSETDSSPVRPVKKAKPRASSSDDDSEEERKRLAAQIKSGTAPKRGTRQPLKRGGKRF